MTQRILPPPCQSINQSEGAVLSRYLPGRRGLPPLSTVRPGNLLPVHVRVRRSGRGEEGKRLPNQLTAGSNVIHHPARPHTDAQEGDPRPPCQNVGSGTSHCAEQGSEHDRYEQDAFLARRGPGGGAGWLTGGFILNPSDGSTSSTSGIGPL